MCRIYVLRCKLCSVPNRQHTFSHRAQAVAYEFNTEFGQTLGQRADYYSSDPAADTINRVRGEISQVRAGKKDSSLTARLAVPVAVHACVTGCCTSA